MSNYLVIKKPITQEETVIEFDEHAYQENNKCKLTNKVTTVQEDFHLLIYEINDFTFKTAVS